MKLDLKAASADLGKGDNIKLFANNIHMIDAGKILANEQNFYAVQQIEKLADDIERQGLKTNLVVIPQEDGTFKIVSGHRRFAAVSLLIEQGRYFDVNVIPCVFEKKDNIRGGGKAEFNYVKRHFAGTDGRRKTVAI